MALSPNFTFAQSADCKTLTFTETTGDGAGGYLDSGNIDITAVTNTILVIKFPDGVTKDIHKDYLPTQLTNPNGTVDYLATDLGYSQIPSGVFDITFKVYSTSTISSNIAVGAEYIVTGVGAQIIYNNITYNENERFIGISGYAYYTEIVAADVNILEAEKQCSILLYCGVRTCLKKLMLQSCGNCNCDTDLKEALTELVVDFNAAQLAFTEANYSCANKTILRLEKQCSGICNDCGC